MIIELFGPSAAGKTTFAHALTQRLRDDGHTVELALSYRPAERPSAVSRSAAVVTARRLAQPLLEMLAVTRDRNLLSQGIGTTTGLVKLLPPRNMAISLRFSQYILRLVKCWHHASGANHIVLFDQAFVQLIYSLVLFARAPNARLVARALEGAPRPDLLVRLDAPIETLITRLEQRMRQQTAIERLFEPDPKLLLNSVGVIDLLDALLRRRGQSVIAASSLDEHSLPDAVDEVANQVAAISDAGRSTMAS